MAVPSRSPTRARIHRPAALIWPPLKIGQRGTSGKARENTLASFALALQEGAEGIALDVRLSAEGVPVVICGSRFNRQGPSRARARFRLFSEVLRWVGDQKCTAYVAIHNPTPDAEVVVLKAINQAKVRHLTRVIANSLPELERIRQLDAKFHLGLRFVGRPPAIPQAKALGAEVLLPHWEVTSPSFIRRAHRASLLVIPWTVNTSRQMRRMILEGVDGIITSYPRKLTDTIARLQKMARAATSRAGNPSPI